MTWQIAAVLGILGISLVLFVTEKLRMDVVALLVLAVLGVSQLVTMEEALAGFSNPAVVTVWAMFILSAGLSATGIADIISRQVLRVAGTGEVRMIFAIMVTAGGLSAFMNNIGVAALMLPVVMDICRKTGISPSRLLMPMAYASLLGGLTTLIGTPPNLVASTALRQAGEEGFTLFEFAPVGVPALIVGAIFIAFVGRHLLPAKMPQEFAETFDEAKGAKGMQFAHSLEERRFRLRVTPGSPLAERSLKHSGLAPVLGLSVLAVERGGSVIDDIDGDFELRQNDVLTVHGRVDEFREFLNWKAFELASGEEILQLLSRERVGLMSLVVAAESKLVGLEVRETDFHRRFGAHILTIRRGSTLHRDGIGGFKLEGGDRLMVDGRREELEALAGVADFSNAEMLSEEQVSDIYTQTDSLLELVIPADSSLVGVTIQQTGFSETLHLRVIGIVRKSGSTYFPAADETFRAGDRWLVHGRPATLDLIRAIQTLEVEEGDLLELKAAGKREFAEVTLSPRSGLAGQSLRDVDFRRRYGLQVLSIWRQGRAYRSHLRNMKLEFGDALLLSGKRERVAALVKDADFLVLSQAAYEESGERRSTAKALLATAIMVAVVVPVLMGKLHISIAALAGAAVMVTCRLLSMSEAYRAIEWKSVFLIAGMIPLGTAMQTSGAAEWVAVQVAAVTEPFGTIGVVVGLYLITAMATMIVPTTALVLIMAPIALQMAGTDPELSPKLVMMAIAMAASASFTSPISHPANVLVMGPGGYRFIDYVKVGVLLAIVVMITVLPIILWRY